MTNKYLKTISICLFSFFILLNSDYLSAQTASITPWRNDAKAVYSIVHDDYSNYVLGIFQNAYPIATQRGIKLSFGAITSACGPTEWANARTMIAQGGHECINHSHNHKCGECSSGNPNCTTVDYGCEGLTTYTTTNFADELTQSDNIIQQQTGKKARFFIHPYDHHTSEILDYLTSLNYLGSRAGTQGQVNPANFANPMKLNYFVWGPSGGQETTVAQLNAAVDAAINVGGYTIREFHNVGPGSITNPWGNITVTNYTQHLNYVKTKMDANQVWSATMSEAITYKMQREVYSPNLTYNAQTGLLTVAFATDLTKLKGISPTLFTPSVFVTPITLKIDVTGISGTISATALQNNAAVSYTRTGNILLLNVYPYNGAVTLNVDVCSADTQKPVFSNCPTDINLSTTATTAIATWTPPSITDNCLPTPIKTSNFESGTAFPIGSTTVVYNATDAKGNTAIPCTFNVLVTQIDPCLTDAEKPNFIRCPSNLQDTTTGASKAVTWIPPTATDNCTTSPVVTSNFVPGSIFPVGSTTVRYDAKDARNNEAFPCTFVVIINKVDLCATDTIKPIIVNCPSNISLTTTGTTGVATWVVPTATDNCAATPSVIGSTTSGTAFPIGVTTVTYNATDTKSNTAIQCIFTVTVVKIDPCETDTIKPIIVNCPANISLTTTGTRAIATWVTPTATDNCTPNPEVIWSFTSGTEFPIGVTKVAYDATDAKGNASIPCIFTVTVVKIDPCDTDTVKPIIVNCPANISLTTTGTTAVATWAAPTATDNCAPTPSVIGSAASSTAFPIGVTTVTYSAADAKGNTAIPCTFTITVVKIDPCATDTVKPIIVNCPSNISLTTTGTTAVATWIAPTATDNCAPTPSVIGSATTGTAFPIGVTTVTYTAADAKGNTAIPCTFTITVVKIDPCATDTVKPIIVNCPSNISLTTTETTAVARWVAPTATDNCAPTPSVIGSSTTGTALPIGVTTVTYNAADAKGNTAIPCTFTITVVKIDPCATDTIKPVLVNCPSNISLTTTGTTAVPTWIAPTATDNCASTPSVIGSASSGTAFPIGVTTVTYNATDAKSNTAIPCSFTVTVSSNPALRDCDALVVVNNNGAINISGITNLATIQVFSSSWSTVYSATVTSPSVNIPNLSTGGYIVKIALYRVANGWTFICEKSFNVTVAIGGGNVCDTDIEKPVFTNCPANINLTTSGATAIATWTPPIATDNCTVTPSVTSNFNSGTAFPIGITNVTYNATDAKNNAAVPCTFKVTVTTASSCATDTEKPVFNNCPSNINLTTSSTSASATWTAPTATDNCTVNPTVTSTHVSGAIFPLGATTVRYTAIDAKNNAAIPCAFVVTVTQVTNVSPCDAYVVKNGGNSIDISGLSNTTTIQIFNATWSPIFNNQTTLASIKIPNIAPGNYYVKLQNYRVNGGWTFLCEKTLNVTVLSTATAFLQSNVEKLTIQASAEMNRVRVEWVTNTGDKNDFYIVQKWLNDKNDFEDLSTINNVDAKMKLQQHVYYDNQPFSGENLYRVKQVSQDGTFKLSETVKVVYSALEGVNIFPNPTDSKLFISFKDYSSNDLTVFLYNSIGQPVKVEKANNKVNALLEMDTAILPEGHYLIRVVSKGKKDFTKQIFVVH